MNMESSSQMSARIESQGESLTGIFAPLCIASSSPFIPVSHSLRGTIRLSHCAYQLTSQNLYGMTCHCIVLYVQHFRQDLVISYHDPRREDLHSSAPDKTTLPAGM